MTEIVVVFESQFATQRKHFRDRIFFMEVYNLYKSSTHKSVLSSLEIFYMNYFQLCIQFVESAGNCLGGKRMGKNH